MSKQVERSGDVIKVRTREPYNDAMKVILLGKGKTAKVFYPFIPNFLTIEEANDLNICGYKAGELVKIAIQLRERGIDEITLKDYNQIYIDGYKKAYDEIEAQITQSIQGIVSGIKDKA